MSKPSIKPGDTFGKLRVLRMTEARTPGGYHIWECRCDCGNFVYAATKQLSAGTKTSCGCDKGRAVSSHKFIPSPAKTDCNVYQAKGPKCLALTEMLCMTRGRCPFYKPIEEGED